LSVDELLERAAPEANLAMLRANAEPSRLQIDLVYWASTLLEAELEFLPLDDFPTRAKILAQLDINQSIVAPIRRLPVEILSYIFSLAAHEPPLCTLNLAVTFSRVCVCWRKVAREHAALWTTVVVETPNDFDVYRELFLPLTKDLPLDLRCDNCDILQDLWDRIAPYASRWRRITLGARLCTLPDLKVLYMERLERLIIFAYGATLSPELSALDFGLTLDVLQNGRQLHIPVTRAITSLVIEATEAFPATRVLHLLQECAKTLQFLTLKIRHPWEWPEGFYLASASDMFSMTALTEVRVNDSACALLNHITAPLIKELVLSNVPAYGSRTLLGFLTRNQSSRHLMDFRVYQTEERDVSAWIPCLELMPSVKDLHFDELLSNADFLKLMIRHADKAPILPSLKMIAISRIYAQHRELRPLIYEMCKSRSTMTTYRGKSAVLVLGWIED
ncbi:hypothetical protein K525DRAFT_199777, partial [Schizophyllum commune Loenen D]